MPIRPSADLLEVLASIRYLTSLNDDSADRYQLVTINALVAACQAKRRSSYC